MVLNATHTGVVGIQSFDMVRATSNGKFTSDVSNFISTEDVGLLDDTFDFTIEDQRADIFWGVVEGEDICDPPSSLSDMPNTLSCYVQDFTRTGYIPWDLSQYGTEFDTEELKLDLSSIRAKNPQVPIDCGTLDAIRTAVAGASTYSIIAAAVAALTLVF